MQELVADVALGLRRNYDRRTCRPLTRETVTRQPDRAWLTGIATSLTGVDGVVGVLLGGSRARGDHSPDSDVDLGVYYRPPLDVEALTELARQIASARESGGLVTVTRPGDWGPWVDGGAWLSIDGVPVDWIYRDLDRVHAAWTDACAGRYRFHVQAGHPLGVPDFAYAGEVGLGTVLADPTGELTGLHARTQDYPPALAGALVDGLWEARFLVAGARKAAARTDTAWIAGCLFRAVGVCVHALHGHAGRWLVNEKGAVRSAGALPGSPADFARRAHALLGDVGTTPEELAASLDAADELITDTARLCAAG